MSRSYSTPSPCRLGALAFGLALVSPVAGQVPIAARIQGLDVDMKSTRHAVEQILRDVERLAPVLPRDALRNLRGARSLIRGIERSALGRAVASLLRNRIELGIEPQPGAAPRLFVRATLATEQEAKDAWRPFVKLFKLPLELAGREIRWSSDGSCEDLPALPPMPNGAPVVARVTFDGSAIARAVQRDLRDPAADAGEAFLSGNLGRAIASGPHLDLELRLTDRGFVTAIRAPRAWERLDEHSKAMFRGTGFALAMPQPHRAHPDEILSITATRDFASFLRGHASFGGKNAVREVQEALAGIELFFRGAVIEDDVAPYLGSRFVTSVRARKADDANAIASLPAFAVVGLAKNHRLQSTLDATVQVVGLVQREQRKRDGKLPLRLRSTRDRDADLRRSWLEVTEPRGDRPLPIQSQLVPSYSRKGPAFAFGTSVDLCADLVSAARAETPEEARAHRVLDRIVFRSGPAIRAMRANESLIATGLWVQRGLDAKSASRVLDGVARLASRIGELTLESRFSKQDGEFVLELTRRLER